MHALIKQKLHILMYLNRSHVCAIYLQKYQIPYQYDKNLHTYHFR